jgi:hypothetical protein
VVKVRVWVHKSRIAGLGLFAAQDIKPATSTTPSSSTSTA